MSASVNRPLKVAILCPGVGLVQRGFERLFRDLFDEVSGHCDVVLFKGGGPQSEREKRVAFLARGGAFLRYVPLHKLIGRTPMHIECLTFALSVLPSLIAGKFDVVHAIDPPLARILFHLRRVTGAKFRLLYTEGTAMPPEDYPPADHIHQISAATFADAARHGHCEASMTTIPCGVRTAKFTTKESKAALRERYGIAQDQFVVLSIAALNRGHKRTHYLIDEFSKVPEGPLLWIDGSLDHGDPDLPDLARVTLGERVKITHVESAKVAELFKMADLFVHTAGFEAFGLSIVEAAICGLPILTHNDAHFRWLIPGPKCQIDMMEPGALSSKITELAQNPEVLPAYTATDYAHRTYAWEALRQPYLALYQSVAGAV